MANIYQDIHKAIATEMLMREGLLDTQRETKCITEEASKVTREVIGNILESIERHWQG